MPPISSFSFPSLFNKSKNSKKGAAIAINIIIVAAIALIVLILIVVIFTGKIKVFGTEIQNCEAKNGVCEQNGCESNEVKLPDTNCAQFCCVDVYDSADDNDN
jgi:flagellar basal body-associated protein FliL